MRFLVLTITFLILLVSYQPTVNAATISGLNAAYAPFIISIAGPQSTETANNPNPFVDYRFNLILTSPSSQKITIPGYFAGNGSGDGSGNIWRAHFIPYETGTWQYMVSFRSGSWVNVSLDPNAGTPTGPNNQTGSFTIAAKPSTLTGMYARGVLRHVGNHYFRFQDGSYWIKGGINSPENFFGYVEFDNTQDQSGSFLHHYSAFTSHWQAGDPTWGTGKGKGIIGTLNYLSSQQVNSIYFLPMNLGGDAQDTYPFISPANTPDAKVHYDISKLSQWQLVMDHAQKKGILLHVVLSEQEEPNENWLPGRTELSNMRKLYYRELISRFGHFPAIQWNLGEEANYSVGIMEQFSEYIKALDWQQHPIAFHTHHPNNNGGLNKLRSTWGNKHFSSTSIQYRPTDTNSYAEEIFRSSYASGYPLPAMMDENNTGSPPGGLSSSNIHELRKSILYDAYFSGGQVEWFFGFDDHTMEDFASREPMYRYTWLARKFMQQYLRFWEMEPRDDLVQGVSSPYGGAQVYAKPGEVYAIYLPSGSTTGKINLTGVPALNASWHDPRNDVAPIPAPALAGGDWRDLPPPPNSKSEDWILYLTNPNAPTPNPTTPPSQAFKEANGLIVIQPENHTLVTGWKKGTSVAGHTGNGYILWNGDDQSTPGNGLISYQLNIASPGRYLINLRSNKKDPNASEDNDVWMRVDSGQWYKTYNGNQQINQWNWNTQYEIVQHQDIPAAFADFTSGLHTLSLSGRSNGFYIDRIHLYLPNLITDPFSTSHPESPLVSALPASQTLVNPSFETGSYMPWFIGPGMDQIYTHVVDCQQWGNCRDGRYYAKLTRGASGDAYIASDWFDVGSSVTDKTFKLQFDVKSHKTTMPIRYMSIQRYPKVNDWDNVTVPMPTFEASTTWKTITSYLTFPQTTNGNTSSQIRVVLRPPETTEPVYYDNIRLTHSLGPSESDSDYDADDDVDILDLLSLKKTFSQLNIFHFSLLTYFFNR